MDPLSITASCLTLIAAVKESSRHITTFVISYRDAHQDMAAMSRELSDLEITLHVLKDDAEANRPDQLPADLRQRICDIIGNCDKVIGDLRILLKKYDGTGFDRSARWAVSGRKDAEKIRSSLSAHKGALGLVVEATTLHLATTAAADTKTIAKDTSLVKEYTMKIVEQLAKQDEILEQIAWIRALITQKPVSDQERTLEINSYLDSMTEYTGSVCGDSISDDVAEKLQRLSLDAPTNFSDSATTLTNALEPSPFPLDDTPDHMTIVIGNTHREVEPRPWGKPDNKHLWSFYLRASGEEIIHQVVIYLHPTFANRKIKLTSPPYKVTRIGWGYFEIDVTIILKRGYLWHHDRSRYLELQWVLDFHGLGSSQSCDYAVIVEKKTDLG